MKQYRNIFFIFVVLFSTLSFARTWEKLVIPGAYCGNGEEYSVFIDKTGSDKLLVEFMSGGACWSEATCYGYWPLTSLSPPKSPKASMLSESSAAVASPWISHDVLYFPYCTGDVHLGGHRTSYKAGISTYHMGYNNVHLALRYLEQIQKFQFRTYGDVTVWGASAGALGAFVHAQSIEPLLSFGVRKTLIADSPGLHFGDQFWKKFPQDLLMDFFNNFRQIDLMLSEDQGFVAPHMAPVFAHLKEWKIGILQSTKDLLMSSVFGGISPENHKKRVLGPEGIAAIATPFPYVQVWIAETNTHVFLEKPQSAKFKGLNGETAWDFVRRVYSSK